MWLSCAPTSRLSTVSLLPTRYSEIWLTFSDPQMKNPRKRLTSTYFMERYRRFLIDGGIVHLKTDSNFLFTYTSYVVDKNHLPLFQHRRPVP